MPHVGQILDALTRCALQGSAGREEGGDIKDARLAQTVTSQWRPGGCLRGDPAGLTCGMKLVLAAVALAFCRAALGQAPSSARATGETTALTIPSKTYPQGRLVWIYTPPGYPASCQGACNTIIAFDGALYLGAMALPSILDSLIAVRATPPAVAVLIDNGGPPGRIRDLANSQQFAAFVGDELLPWLRDHYVVTRAPAKVVLAGVSAGGLAAAYIAMKYPSLFGRVLSQSGAFWRGNEASDGPPYEWLTQHVASSPRSSITFFIDVGTRETVGALGGRAPSLLDANRRLSSALIEKGYAAQYFEVPGGAHSPETWHTRLPQGIVALLPVQSAER